MSDLLPFAKPKDREGRIILSKGDYRRLRKQVYSEQGKACARCRRRIWTLAEMELNHKRLRKMGGGSRDDRRENVEGLCQDCHRKEHNQ